MKRGPLLVWIAVLWFEEIRFLTPARPDDVIVFENESISKREFKSDSNAGIDHFAAKLLNKWDEPIITCEEAALVEKRPAKRTPSSLSSAR